ncbi:MAG: hypothetical protein R3B36_07935 [Polyangiaceae bacterium]
MSTTRNCLFFFAATLAACSAAPDLEDEAEAPLGHVASAMIHNRENSCSASQLAGGYEDVDGVCLLTCWNCPGWQGGGSGPVPGGCHTPSCDGPGGGSGGGGSSGGGSSGGLPVCPPGDPGFACTSRCSDTFFTCLSRCESSGGRAGTCWTRCDRAKEICERACDRRYPPCVTPVGPG